MSDVSAADPVAAAIRRQMGTIPQGKFKKKKAAAGKPTPSGRSSEDSVTGHRGKEIFEGEEVPRPVRGSIGRNQEIIDAEIVEPRKAIGGGRKALPKPPTRALEAPKPPTKKSNTKKKSTKSGPLEAEVSVDLREGPNFGKPIYTITELPRQFKGKSKN